MKAKEKDFYRWLAYGIVLLVIAAASFAWQSVLWLFVPALILALGDIFYTQYTRYLGH